MSESGKNPNSSDSAISESETGSAEQESHALEEGNFSGSALDSHLTQAVDSVNDPVDDILSGNVTTEEDEQSSDASDHEESDTAGDVTNEDVEPSPQIPNADVESESQSSASVASETPAQASDQNFDLDEISRQMEEIDTSPPWMPREETAASVPSMVDVTASDASAESTEGQDSPPLPETSDVSDQDGVAVGVGVGAATFDAVTPQYSTDIPTGAAGTEDRPPVAASGLNGGSAKKESKGVPSTVFMVVVSYASVVTLICIYLVMQSMNAKPHELESLPDIKPPMKNDEIAYRLAPENAPMAKGHTLKIGETRRFGNIRLTPIKVSYEPVKFEHFSGDSSRQREADGPVLKLWMKFENVSDDQKFPPLDRKLMLIRIADRKNPEWLRSNNFVCSEVDKNQPGIQTLIYDLELSGDWNFASIPDDLSIGPGENMQCYLPSEPVDLDAFTGPMIWRVQFRKGYHPESYRGVTTLIEVQFDPSEIEKSA